jgi:hypothetical protein
VNAPRRVRVAGDLFHPQVPDGAVYVGRQAPGLRRSPWANPFKEGARTASNLVAPFADVQIRNRAHAVDLFRQLADVSPDYRREVREHLRGRDLACWCRPDQQCHADVLLDIANAEE